MKRRPAKRKTPTAKLVGERDAASLSAILRVRRIQRLCAAFEFDSAAGELIVELVERIETLQRDLQRLRPGR